MENMCSSSAATSSSALTSTGRRRCRHSMLKWFAVLALAPISSSAREVSRGVNRRNERTLQFQLPVDHLDDVEYRKPNNGFPGLTFYEDKDLDDLGAREWTSTYQQTASRNGDANANALRWQWRHKSGGYASSDDDCTSTKASNAVTCGY